MLLLLLVACKGEEKAPSNPDECLAGAPAEGEVRVLAEGLSLGDVVGTEGITFSPDGRLFVGGSALSGGWVGEVSPDGAWTLLQEVPSSIGLAWWGERLIIASGDTGEGEGGLYSMDPAGAPELIAGGMLGSNFPAVTPWGTVLVSAPMDGLIYEVTADGAVSTWTDAVASPNGMAFDAAGETLYVAQTYDPSDTFVSVAISGQQAGEVATLAAFQDNSTQDGVAMDSEGDVYVVLNLPGQVVRITPAGETEIVAEGVQWGASLAFGEGEGWDPCSLYATSLFGDKLYQIGTGRVGMAPLR